jgi:hypothetical protein
MARNDGKRTDNNSKRCPYCGWIYDEGGRPCPHFVVGYLVHWEGPYSYLGQTGTFGIMADEVLWPAVKVVWAFQGGDSDDDEEGSEGPVPVPRLQDLADGINQCESVEPGPERDLLIVATSDYVRAIFEAAAPEGEVTDYETRNKFDEETEVFLWSPDAAKTARKMARIVAQDVKQLRREIPRT